MDFHGQNILQPATGLNVRTLAGSDQIAGATRLQGGLHVCYIVTDKGGASGGSSKIRQGFAQHTSPGFASLGCFPGGIGAKIDTINMGIFTMQGCGHFFVDAIEHETVDRAPANDRLICHDRNLVTGGIQSSDGICRPFDHDEFIRVFDGIGSIVIDDPVSIKKY
jgi:hypothetical protein